VADFRAGQLHINDHRPRRLYMVLSNVDRIVTYELEELEPLQPFLILEVKTILGKHSVFYYLKILCDEKVRWIEWHV